MKATSTLIGVLTSVLTAEWAAEFVARTPTFFILIIAAFTIWRSALKRMKAMASNREESC